MTQFALYFIYWFFLTHYCRKYSVIITFSVLISSCLNLSKNMVIIVIFCALVSSVYRIEKLSSKINYPGDAMTNKDS